jgi:hypothetical protein
MTSTKPRFNCEHVQKGKKTAWFNQWNRGFCYLIITSLLHAVPSCRPIVSFLKYRQRDSSAAKKERWLSTPIGHYDVQNQIICTIGITIFLFPQITNNLEL